MQEKFESTIIILSAGNGERMNSSLPKVLHEVGCQLLIEYVLKLSMTISSDASDIYMVISKNLKENKHFKSIHNQYAFKQIIQEKKLGTGDAVKIAYNHIKDLKELVLVLYGDTPFIKPKTIHDMLQQIVSGAELSIVGFNAKNPTSYGRIISLDTNKAVEIVEDKEASQEQKNIFLCNSGIMLMKKETLSDFLGDNDQCTDTNEFCLTDIVKHIIERGKACTYVIADEEEVMGVNDREQLAVAEEYVQKITTKNMMEKGATVIKPETSYFAVDIEVSPDVTIYPNVFIGRNTTIMNGAKIHSFSYIEGALIEEGAVIGPFARIRPTTKIGKKSKIGNFVEVKNSILMEGVKAGHLSYIGDATICDDVNIGAGTVFCNYDGKYKHHSEVGEKSFIGSNTSIISPVTIKSKATVAAGSVITKNVEKNDLAIARSKQINLKNKSKVKS